MENIKKEKSKKKGLGKKVIIDAMEIIERIDD